MVVRRWLLVSVCFLASCGVASAQRTTLTHTVVDVGIATTVVLPVNMSRNFLLLTNSSDADIYCKFGAVAVVQEGFFIRSAGGGLLLDEKFSAQTLNCIHGASGTKPLEVSEGVQ